jgi:prepilin-type N-terminal cleavage/methylation domain-containing protein
VNTKRRSSGFTLIEVLAAMAILTVSVLGLTAGVLVAFSGNGRSSRRTQMVEFAQSRLDRLTAATKVDICTGTFQGGVVSCTKMNVTPFDPNAAPGTGGWMLDVLDRPATTGTTAAGVDLMAGPVLVLGDVGGAIDENATLTARANLMTEWGTLSSGGAGLGCASALVAKNMLCRELHIEFDSVTSPTYYHVWVRVSRGQSYTDGPVVLEGMIAK